MKTRSASLPIMVGKVFGVAAAWMLAFTLNETLLAATQQSARANWIFLPASIRLLSVLLFGEIGAFGLAIGSFLTFAMRSDGGWLYGVGLAVSSGLAPLLAVRFCRKFLGIAEDLGGLCAWHIVVLSAACAASNTILLNACMALGGEWQESASQVASVFVGDLLGTAIVLFMLSSALAFALPKRRS